MSKEKTNYRPIMSPFLRWAIFLICIPLLILITIVSIQNASMDGYEGIWSIWLIAAIPLLLAIFPRQTRVLLDKLGIDKAEQKSAEPVKTENTSDDSNYWGWAMLVGFLVFAGIWIYAMATWGLLWGLMFGWIPALIGGIICGLLWPLVVIVVVILAYLIFK